MIKPEIMGFEDIAPLNEVERLRIENACCHEEIERLRAALREIAYHTTTPEGSGPAYRMVGKLVRTARAALEERT